MGTDEQRFGPDEWPSYRLMILDQLKRVSADVDAINAKLDRFRDEDISEIRVDIAMLKVKASAWGAIGGVIVAGGTLLLKFVGANGP